MFKLLGCIFIVVSCTFLFYKKSIIEYQTYLYLKDITYIANQIKLLSAFNDTYDNIFKRINLNNTVYFKDFDFLKRDSFIKSIAQNKSIDENAIKNSQEFLNNLGKQNRQAEEEYININLTIFNQVLTSTQETYQNNKKLNLMAGASVGLIIILIII